MRGLTILFLMISFSLQAASGDRELLAADIDSMRAGVSANKLFSAEMVVINKGVENFIPEIKAIIHRNGEQVYYKVLHLEYLFGDKYTLAINHSSKTIAYSKKDSAMREIFSLVPDIDSIIARYDSVSYIGEVKGSRKYYIYTSNAQISKVEFYYSPLTKFISKLVYHYNADYTGEDAVVTVEYRNVEFHPSFKADEFSTTRFLVSKGKQFIPVSALYGYSVSEAQTEIGKF